MKAKNKTGLYAIILSIISRVMAGGASRAWR